MNFSVNLRHMYLKVTIQFASWLVGAATVYYQQISMYTCAFALNITLAVVVFTTHIWAHPKVINFLRGFQLLTKIFRHDVL